MVRVLWGNEILLPPFHLNLTSFLPQVYLLLTSFLPLFLPQFNLCFVTNLEPRFGNHGLQTLGDLHRPFFHSFAPAILNTISNQEPRKGGFSKGGFCRVQCHAHGNKKIAGGIGPSSTFGTQSATAKRGINFCKKKTLRKPFLGS